VVLLELLELLEPELLEPELLEADDDSDLEEPLEESELDDFSEELDDPDPERLSVL